MGLIESSGGIAVTEVKEEVCQGCNMNIPPQLYVEIKSNEEIIQCPQCRRILYYKGTP
jgi:predicted  nucleic acid-binding Zn-ribbon protein